ncbi:P-loop containing nucleoside triphosphate hydrolase protein [Podospora aff. communis PSN243]|uniref:P-loop containing nucleoside triphosphate hydrolase protein n=1 Tax=Podospora aff. communis PSN243 TaxID=3040156 RepID=A0AAV9G5F2_9PEZI|nr:P-loop containing nucleoside triphosphate hydrolase protein [Podospora aff. communis PSN243]
MPNMQAACPPGSDDVLGPRVDPACRDLDFTLFFEDVFFTALPAAAMLLLLPLQMRKLWNRPAINNSYRLALTKLAALAVLISFHLLTLAFRIQLPLLHTKAIIAAEALSAFVNYGALVASFLQDQRSVQPSDVLVVYYSTTVLLGVARLRTLWLFSFTSGATDSGRLKAGMGSLRVVATAQLAATAVVAALESVHKTRYMQAAIQKSGVTLEQCTSFWARNLFVWVLPVFQQGYKTVFSVQSLPEVDPELRESRSGEALDGAWRRSKSDSHTRFRLVRATASANSWPLLSAVVPRLSLSAFAFCQPFLIQAAVGNLSRDSAAGEERRRQGQALVGAFALAYLGTAVSRAVYWRQTYRMLTRVRAGLTTAVYRKTLQLRASQVGDAAALTLMGTDVERIVESLRFLHETWASVPEVAVGVWLLAREVSYTAAAPLVVCVASLVASSLVARHFGPAQSRWVAAVADRVGATAAFLRDVRLVKMLGLTARAQTHIEGLRVIEMDVSARFRALRVWAITVGNAPSSLAPFVTLALFSLLTATAGGGRPPLLVAQAFTSLALIVLVTEPLLMFCQALPGLTQAVACFGRLEVFLDADPISTGLLSASSPQASTESSPLSNVTTEPLLALRNTAISWTPEGPAVLRDLRLDIEPRAFTAVTGPVGSGKSTLLSAIVGEAVVQAGTAELAATSRVAFCAQSPWLVNNTIQQNIIGPYELDESWLADVVDLCGLREDLERLPGGSMAVVGDDGASLSGGQRQRVALARAVYSRLPLVVLDDSMSGLDHRTARRISDNLLARDEVLSQMDKVILLDGGKLLDSGSYDEIRQRRPLVNAPEHFSRSVPGRVEDSPDDIQDGILVPPVVPLKGGCVAKEERDAAVLTAQEAANPDDTNSRNSRQTGNWAVYAYYARKAGKVSVILWFIATFVGAVAGAYSVIWVDSWTAANLEAGSDDLGFYIGIYFVFVSLAILGPLGECWVFFLHIVKDTAMKLHSDLVQAVVRAPFHFFLGTDVGTIANRFSQDMNLIDMTLPSQALQFTSGLAWCLVQLIVLCVLGKSLSAVVPVLALVLFSIQRYYLRTSRQLRILDIEAKAPLYAHFIDTIGGITTIRAFGWGHSFSATLAAALDMSQRPFYMLFCVQQWLTLVLDLVAGGLAVTLVALALSMSDGTGLGMSPGALGVALVLTLQFNGLLIQTIQAWTKLETSIGAVARVRQFLKETPIEPTGTAPPSESWPAAGVVAFHNLTAAYTPRSAPVLLDVNLTIAPGEKIAICGASGSGKTSLVMALLKMMEVRSGQVHIDHVNIASLDGPEMRSRLTVIPQSPFFMAGTLQFNLDPANRQPRGAVEKAVEQVSPGLWEKLQRSGGLDAEFAMSEWSHGERQLLCLARALLTQSGIVVLDEATSSADSQTEAVIQEVVRTKFRDRTVISVIHRYTHIDWFDRVAVFEGGRIVECDGPRALLESEGSALRRLALLDGSLL